jgi:hypothetical protein
VRPQPLRDSRNVQFSPCLLLLLLLLLSNPSLQETQTLSMPRGSCCTEALNYHSVMFLSSYLGCALKSVAARRVGCRICLPNRLPGQSDYSAQRAASNLNCFHSWTRYNAFQQYRKCFRAAQFAVSGNRSDQQGTKVTEPFRVGTATQKILHLLLQTKLLSYQHCVSGLLFPRPVFAGPSRTDYLNTSLSCTTPPRSSVDEASKLKKSRNKLFGA